LEPRESPASLKSFIMWKPSDLLCHRLLGKSRMMETHPTHIMVQKLGLKRPLGIS
jgi:hypothetical protein